VRRFGGLEVESEVSLRMPLLMAFLGRGWRIASTLLGRFVILDLPSLCNTDHRCTADYLSHFWPAHNWLGYRPLFLYTNLAHDSVVFIGEGKKDCGYESHQKSYRN
jgi:hypothetical protein